MMKTGHSKTERAIRAVWAFVLAVVMFIFLTMKTTKIVTTPAGGKPTEGTAVVQSGVEAAQAVEVRRLGTEVIKATGAVAVKYHALVMFIRNNSVSPKLAAFELTSLGFKRSRVSEVNRIAHAKDEVFKEYAAKQIGFDRALELARSETKGGAMKATPAAQNLLGMGALEAPEVSDIADEAGRAADRGVSRSPAEIMKSSALAIFSRASRPHVFKSADGKWVMSLVYGPKHPSFKSPRPAA